MIGVKLMGGLGNQMFQYALGSSIAVHNNNDLVLDLSFFEKQPLENTQRYYSLNCFKLDAKLCKKTVLGKKPIFYFGTDITYFENLYLEKEFKFDNKALLQPDKTLFEGYWQTEKYFKNIKKKLINDFALARDISREDAALEEKIKNCNSVSLHVRRGDYVNNQNANKFHGLKGIDYYKKAIKIINKTYREFTIFIFSDDIAWCKKNLSKIHDNIIFVGGDRVDYVDMHLMKNCSHNIIANSSFSWWAAWLNENKSKIVVAPKIWFNDPNTSTVDIIPKSWIKI